MIELLQIRGDNLDALEQQLDNGLNTFLTSKLERHGLLFNITVLTPPQKGKGLNNLQDPSHRVTLLTAMTF